MRITIPSIGLIIAVLGCDNGQQDVTAPNARQQSFHSGELQFVRFDPALYATAERHASVLAVMGATAYLKLRYLGGKPLDDKEVFLDLEIGGSSLWKRPDGRPFKDGDTITISVAVDEGGSFAFKFEPAGLMFHPKAQPKLRLWCLNPGNNLKDDDGDDHANPGLNVWVRESDHAAWFQSTHSWHKVQTGLLEAVTHLGGFTRFAMASN